MLPGSFSAPTASCKHTLSVTKDKRGYGNLFIYRLRAKGSSSSRIALIPGTAHVEIELSSPNTFVLKMISSDLLCFERLHLHNGCCNCVQGSDEVVSFQRARMGATNFDEISCERCRPIGAMAM